MDKPDAPSLYPHLPPPPTSSRRYAYEPSAPPSVPPPSPPPSTSSSAALYPELAFSPSAPPLPQPRSPPLTQTPWRASSLSPTEADLHAGQSFSELPEQPHYPSLQQDQPYPHKALQPERIGDHRPLRPSPNLHRPQLNLDISYLRTQADQSSNHLREIYENSYLQELPQRLAKYEGSSTSTRLYDDDDNSFMDRMRSYEAAHEAVQQSKLAIFNLQQKAKGYASKLWMVQTKTEIVKATCGDGAIISHNYSYQYGHHKPEIVTKLKKSLERIVRQKTKSLTRVQFEETSCRLWIQDHLATFLNGIVWKDKTDIGRTKQDLGRTPRVEGTKNQQDLERIKGYLDILFQFEKNVRRQPDFGAEAKERKSQNTSESLTIRHDGQDEEPETARTNSILQSIHDWIALLAATLLQHGGFTDYEYLTIQVLRRRKVANWAACFVQCTVPSTWTSAFQDFYITELELVLCGTSLHHKKSLSEGALTLGSDLEEEDYLAILDQLDLTLFLNRLLIEHKAMHDNDGSILKGDISQRTALRLLATTRHVFDVLIRSLQLLIAFPMVLKRLSQILCQLAQILGDHLLVLGPMEFNARSRGAAFPIALDRDTATSSQAELDRMLLDVVRALLTLDGRGVWTFLPSLPFKFMSSPTIALLLEDIALDNIHQWVKEPSALLSATPETNKLRLSLGRNPGEAVFLLTAMAAMATSRFDSTPDDRPSDSLSLDRNISFVVAFLLTDVAYLDHDIRRELTKPTREILSSICDTYPEAIGFILRIVESTFAEMGDMAQYLFRGLLLDEWLMSNDDFMRLRRMLETPPLSSAQSGFARYVFGALPWSQENSTVFDGEERSRIPNDFRKELALAMGDMCVQNLSNSRVDADTLSTDIANEPKDGSASSPLSRTKSPDTKFVPTFASSLPHAITNLAVHSGIHRSAEQTSTKAFMDWCWSMLSKLELTEVPAITLVEASRLHVQDPGLAKYPLFSQGQLTFVNTTRLLLTEDSRNAELFLQEGWPALKAVLLAGVGSMFLELVGRLIPSIISMDADLLPHAAPFGQLLRESAAWKQDPFLAVAGAQLVSSKNLSPNRTPEELIGVWYLLHQHLDHCKVNSCEPATVLKFWMAAVFSQKDWMAHQECVQVLDVICLFCFELGLDAVIKDALMEQQIMLSIGFRRAPGMSAELMGLAQPGFDRVMDMLPERLLKTLPVPQGSNDPSLLMGTWSVRSFATNLLTQQAMVETGSIWFAYYVLSIETSLEREMRIKVGNHYRQHPAELETVGNIKSVMKNLGITSRKTLQNFAIWRWAQHLLILPYDTYLLPLFWQMFFYLYYGHVEQRDRYYGYKFLETSPEMVEQLRDRLQQTYTYFGKEAQKAIRELDPVKAGPLTALHEFYIALHGWISEPLLLTAGIDFKRIRKDLMADRLIACRLPDPLECNMSTWRDLLVDRSITTQPVVASGTHSMSPDRFSPTSYSSANSPRSRTTSYDQARAMRRHGHAWQDQKISNSLSQHSKAGPDFYIPRMLVQSPVIDNKASPQNLFNQPVRILKDYCRTYRAANDAYENLDASYLSELGALYHNEFKTTKLEIACDTTPNTLCKRPAVIEIKYEEIVVNESIKQSIVENRERAQALRLGTIEQGLCLAALEIFKIIDTILLRLNSTTVNMTLQQLSTQSFYYLCGELLDDARGYSPAHIVLSSIIDTLGMQVVAKDPDLTEKTLDLMKTDDFIIAMLYKTFYPAAVPSGFVRLYKRIAIRKDYGLASKDLLLRQFDVQAWACDTAVGDGKQRSDGPSSLNRLEFYEVAFTAMMAQQQLQKQDDQIQESTELSTRDRLAIIKSHRELAGTLFLNFLQQDYIDYLRILFDTCGIMCLEPEVLEDFIRILGVEPRLVPALLDDADVTYEAGSLIKGSKAFTNVGLSDYDLGRLVQFLADYFTECQQGMVRGNLLDRYSGYAVSIASLLTVVLCDERYLGQWMKSPTTPFGGPTANHGQHDGTVSETTRRELLDPGHCRMWRDTVKLFQPWISCLTEHAVDEKQFQRQQSGASRVLFTFVGTLSKMMGALKMHYHDTTPMMVEIYDFWLEMMHQSTLGQGSINQIMLIHQHFHRLDWKDLELSENRLDRTLDVAAELNDEIKIEFWMYLVTVVMEKADASLRPRALQGEANKGTVKWHQTESAFLRLGLGILQDVDMVAGNDMDVRLQLLGILWSVIFSAGDWALLTTDRLQHLIEGLKIHWDRAGLWDDRSSPLGLMLYWMRIAVGLESDSFEELDEDLGAASLGCQSLTLSSDRVLVYFGYLLRLLQARLASSAQDSQNINFKMDAIPLVLIHLGQVLDAIAGNSPHEKYLVIYRPLLSLVGVLNQCGKGPSLALVSSSADHSFDVVLRGLCRMISEVSVIQLDIVKVICQRVNSISAMISLLEEAIEREFDLRHGQQGSTLGGSGSRSFTTSSGAVFGLEDTTLQQTMSPVNMMAPHARYLHGHSSYSEHSRGRSSPWSDSFSGQQSWGRIKAQIEAPELSEDEFLEQGLKQGAILTIYGRFLQRLDDLEQQSMDFDEVLGLGQELSEVISKVDLMAIEPWKAYQSLLLLRMFFRIVAKESVHSILQSRFLSSLRQVCRTLEIWCQDRDSTKGMLSSIGMGTRSSFDTKFRLVIRIIYTYVVVRFGDKGVSVHEGQGQGGGGGGVLAWRKGRHHSAQDVSPTAGDGRGRGSHIVDNGATLIDALAQLPAKNKDYAAVFVALSSTTLATTADAMPTTPTAMESSMALLPALASSPLGLMKKVVMSSSPSPPPSNTGSPPPAGSTIILVSQQGTKNGVQDLEWAVQRIKDRRFRILEAAEVLAEVMDRFYEGDDYFA
ncbi:hypothetical protein BGZ98_002722 [Dissophora globulifera]|nr:hypothetical protein BGZ98_002722 [Dissophora globulifera]